MTEWSDLKGGSRAGGQKVAGLTSTFANLCGYWIHSSSCCGEALFDTIRRFSSRLRAARTISVRMLILRCSSHILMPHGLHHRREIPVKDAPSPGQLIGTRLPKDGVRLYVFVGSRSGAVSLRSSPTWGSPFSSGLDSLAEP